MRIEAITALTVGLSACASSSALAPRERLVASVVEREEWTPATARDLDGLFESVEIEGDAAATLMRIYYCFDASGAYTGAALTTGEHTEFQTLSGSWELAEGSLRLGEDIGIQASIAGDFLKLESSGGTAVLKREALR